MNERELEVVRINLFDTRPFSRGRTARLSVESSPNGGTYEVRVEGADQRHLYLEPPQADGQALHLPPGAPVGLRIDSPHGRCEFSTVVAQAGAAGDGCLALVLPAQARRLQRRQHLRAAVSLPLRLARLPGPGEPPAGLSFADGRTSNISAGGLSFTTEVALAPGDLAALSFVLPDSRRKVKATCEVTRQDGACDYAARFADIDDRLLAELTAFIIRRRRARRVAGPSRTGPGGRELGSD